MEGEQLRDCFASQALAGLLLLSAQEWREHGLADPSRAARLAYEYADAMLAARGGKALGAEDKKRAQYEATTMRQEAVQLLQHYLKRAFAGGRDWNSDCDVETAAIVDCILRAARAEARA